MATKTYAQWRQEKLADPERAARYLNAAYRDSKEAFQYAVLNVIQAHKVAKVAKHVGVARESVYRSFSADGNPAFYTVDAVMKLADIDIEFKAASERHRGKDAKPRNQNTAHASGNRRPILDLARTQAVPIFDGIYTSPKTVRDAGVRGPVWTITSDTNGLIPLPLEQQYSPRSTPLANDLFNLILPTRTYARGQQNTAAIPQEFDRVQ